MIVERDWPGFGPQKNRALDALGHRLDPVPRYRRSRHPELAQSIRDTIRAPAAQVYAVDRLSSFCGQWIHHSGWYPDWIPRLFRRGAARRTISCTSASCRRQAQRLSGKLMHYSYEDFETVVRKLDAIRRPARAARRAAGQRGGFGGARARRPEAFVRTYVLRRGFLDGRAGFMIAVFNAETVYYRFPEARPRTAR